MRRPSLHLSPLVLVACAGAPLPPGVDPYEKVPVAPTTMEALVDGGLDHPFRLGDPLYVRQPAQNGPFARRRIEPASGIYLVWQRGRTERAEVVQVAFPDEKQLQVDVWQERTGRRLGDTVAWLQNPDARNRGRMSQIHVADIRHPVPCVAVDGADFLVVVRNGKVDSLVWSESMEALALLEGEPLPVLLARCEAAVASGDLGAARPAARSLAKVLAEAPKPPSWAARAAQLQASLARLEGRGRQAAADELARLVAAASERGKDAAALVQLEVFAQLGTQMLDLVSRSGAEDVDDHPWRGYRARLQETIGTGVAKAPEDSAEALLLRHLAAAKQWPSPMALGQAIAEVRRFDAADEFRAAMAAMRTLGREDLQVGNDQPARWQRALAMVADRAASAWRAADRPLCAEYLEHWGRRFRTTRFGGKGPGLPRAEELDSYTASLGGYPHQADVPTRRAWLEQCKARSRDANGHVDQFSLENLTFLQGVLQKL